MSGVFVDAFYFLARLNPGDESHEQAVRVGTQETRPIVTTAWVLTEVADAMSSPANRPAFLRLLETLQILTRRENHPADGRLVRPWRPALRRACGQGVVVD